MLERLGESIAVRDGHRHGWMAHQPEGLKAAHRYGEADASEDVETVTVALAVDLPVYDVLWLSEPPDSHY